MKEKIYTIMINEAIDEDNGCPLCLIKEKLEQNALEYYMGAAMMEPDVRMETNNKGFCGAHAKKMLKMGNRLSLALMLDTHAIETIDKIKKVRNGGIFGKKESEHKSCAVCDRVNEQMGLCISNFAYLLDSEPDFAEKFIKSEGVCVAHFYDLYTRLKSKGAKLLKEHTVNSLEKTEKALLGFTKSFDYNGAPPDKEQAQSPETGIAKLCAGK